MNRAEALTMSNTNSKYRDHVKKMADFMLLKNRGFKQGLKKQKIVSKT